MMKNCWVWGIAFASVVGMCTGAMAQSDAVPSEPAIPDEALSTHDRVPTKTVGAATMYLAPKRGDRHIPKAPYRTDAMLKTAAQAAQWYSSLIYKAKPEVFHALPMTFKATAAGFEFALPSKEVVATKRRDVEIRYPHRKPLEISPVAFAPGQSKLARADDWSIDVAQDQGDDKMRVTIAHGSPYASVQLSRGDARLRLPAAGERFDTGDDARILALRVAGKAYALFGPSGVRWEQVSPQEWIARLPQGKGYLSAAGMPDDRQETLALFARHAYAFIDGTRADWKYDPEASQVETTFHISTKIMEGADNGPLIGLYPHHWYNNPLITGTLDPSYDTVRGKIKLIEASQFKIVQTYTGFVPYWPGLTDPAHISRLEEVMPADLRKARRMMLEEGRGTYWQGKGLHRIMKMLDVIEQQGNLEGRDRLLDMVKERAEQWFVGKGKTYFHLSESQGTIASYPEEYYFVEQLNDHHFVYGYWIRAAADIALRDPAWIAKDKWGGMVDLLVRDIATGHRGGSDFSFVRNFDVYEGHSWAAGVPHDEYGDNQESSSEAVNAWASLILWAEVTGDTRLRDLGLFLYTSEIESLRHYWFNVHGQVFPTEYMNTEATIVFGGKYIHNTWWTDEPRQIKGINFLPLNTSSIYLGRYPEYIKRSLGTLPHESKVYSARGKTVDPTDMWQDIFAKTMGLVDPVQGLAQWDRWGTFEFGDTRTHALHWLLSLNEMGTPDFGVTANTTLYGVFKRPDGNRTYLAFNAGRTPIEVKFSDGKTLTVAPGVLGQIRQ